MRVVSKIAGVLLVMLAIWGVVDTGFGLTMVQLGGTLTINAVLMVLYLIVGVWGYRSSVADQSAGHFGRWAGAILLAAGGAGFAFEAPLGLLPLGGMNRFFHLGLGIVLLLAGLVDASRPRASQRRR